MSKKRIIIYVILSLFIASLVWFVFPKKASIGEVDCVGCTWRRCQCFGISIKAINRYVCFGLVRDCEIKETEASVFAENYLNNRVGLKDLGGNSYYEYKGKIAFCSVYIGAECWILNGVDVKTFEYLGKDGGDFYARDKNDYYKNEKLILPSELPQTMLHN